MISFARLSLRVLFPSSPLSARTGTVVKVNRARVAWKCLDLAVRRLSPDGPWSSTTAGSAYCLVLLLLTPSDNWASCPPHAHDVDRPPQAVKLGGTYCSRFEHPGACGFQRLYGRDDDRTLPARHGDVVTVRHRHHPFVTAYGYNSSYLKVLAGQRRSLAASDDPRHAAFRTWPDPDRRLPLLQRPLR